MKVDRKMIEYVADLSRLELSEEEKVRAEKDLGSVIDYIELMNTLDTDGIEPLSHTFPIKNVMREDEVKQSYDRDTLLENAPVVKDGCFKVPRTVE